MQSEPETLEQAIDLRVAEFKDYVPVGKDTTHLAFAVEFPKDKIIMYKLNLKSREVEKLGDPWEV